jgi:hypothetical protein
MDTVENHLYPLCPSLTCRNTTFHLCFRASPTFEMAGDSVNDTEITSHVELEAGTHEYTLYKFNNCSVYDGGVQDNTTDAYLLTTKSCDYPTFTCFYTNYIY